MSAPHSEWGWGGGGAEVLGVRERDETERISDVQWQHLPPLPSIRLFLSTCLLLAFELNLEA